MLQLFKELLKKSNYVFESFFCIEKILVFLHFLMNLSVVPAVLPATISFPETFVFCPTSFHSFWFPAEQKNPLASFLSVSNLRQVLICPLSTAHSEMRTKTLTIVVRACQGWMHTMRTRNLSPRERQKDNGGWPRKTFRLCRAFSWQLPWRWKHEENPCSNTRG